MRLMFSRWPGCAGPNEAGEDALKAQVDRLLDSVDVCIYLLDYTKLKTQVGGQKNIFCLAYFPACKSMEQVDPQSVEVDEG